VFFLWAGYSPYKDENDIVYQRSTSIYETVTPETRTARMRKALREKAEDLKIHEELVANQLKQQQNLLDEYGSGETEAERAIILSNVLKWEEKEIQRFASHSLPFEDQSHFGLWYKSVTAHKNEPRK